MTGFHLNVKTVTLLRQTTLLLSEATIRFTRKKPEGEQKTTNAKKENAHMQQNTNFTPQIVNRNADTINEVNHESPHNTGTQSQSENENLPVSQNSNRTPIQNEAEDEDITNTQVPSESQELVDGDEYFDAEQDHEELDDMSDDEMQGIALNNLSPNVNDDPASEEFIDRLKNLMASYSDDKWEEFEALVEEVTTAAQVHVKIKNIETTFQIRNGDARDPTSTQRTYRRNRRRAMRLVKGEQNSYCKVQVDELKKKFFIDEFPEPDLSIYDNCKKAEEPPSAAMFSTLEVKRKLKSIYHLRPLT